MRFGAAVYMHTWTLQEEGRFTDAYYAGLDAYLAEISQTRRERMDRLAAAAGRPLPPEAIHKLTQELNRAVRRKRHAQPLTAAEERQVTAVIEGFRTLAEAADELSRPVL